MRWMGSFWPTVNGDFSEKDATRLLALLILQIEIVTPQVLARKLTPNPEIGFLYLSQEKDYSPDFLLLLGRAARSGHRDCAPRTAPLGGGGWTGKLHLPCFPRFAPGGSEEWALFLMQPTAPYGSWALSVTMIKLTLGSGWAPESKACGPWCFFLVVFHFCSKRNNVRSSRNAGTRLSEFKFHLHGLLSACS